MDGPNQDCTICIWCSHTVGTQTVWHIRIPIPGCPTHPWGVFPPPPPPCKCKRNQQTGELTHDPECPSHP